MKEKIDLWKVFENINKWLDFAERKNMTLFTMVSIIPLIVILINSLIIIPATLKFYLVTFLACYILSFISTMLSLFPITKFSKLILSIRKNQELTKDDNLLYYGDIQKYPIPNFESAFVNSYKTKKNKLTKFEKDILGQISINSLITYNKLVYYRFSAFSISFGIISILLGIIHNLLEKQC